MAKKSPKEEDPNQTAHATLTQFPARNDAPDKPEKNPAAVALGRLGGLKGGKARAASLTKEKRAEIAKKAAAARWKN